MSAEPIDFAVVPVAPSPEGWTIADLDALPDRDGVRYELVDGVPHVMTPPRIGHQNALLEVHLAIRATLPPGVRVVQGVGVVLAPDQRPIPDLVAIRSTDVTLSNVPAEDVVLAAEVVSRSSRSDSASTSAIVIPSCGQRIGTLRALLVSSPTSASCRHAYVA